MRHRLRRGLFTGGEAAQVQVSPTGATAAGAPGPAAQDGAVAAEAAPEPDGAVATVAAPEAEAVLDVAVVIPHYNHGR